MSNISTHVLDLASGAAAPGITVALERQSAEGAWTRLADASTDSDGRVKALLSPGTSLAAATYRLTWQTGAYWHARGVQAFHPVVDVTFVVNDPARHHHVPLLISPFGYSTYRGT